MLSSTVIESEYLKLLSLSRDTMIDWDKVKYFKPSEFTEPDKMNPRLIDLLDLFREEVGQPIKINASYATKGHSPDSQHYKGNAVDVTCRRLDSKELFFYAIKFPWGGIGLYNWGLHLDLRPLRLPRPTWARISGNYVPLNLHTWNLV